MGNEHSVSIKRRLASGLAATGIAVVAAVGLTAGSAHAETTEAAEPRAGTCAAGYVCGWEEDGYGGDKWVNWKPGSTGAKHEIDWWNGDNEITSIINNSNYGIMFYDGDGQSGSALCVGKGVKINNLQSYAWNDRIESAQAIARC